MTTRIMLISRDGDGRQLPPRTKKNSGDILCPHQIRGIKFHAIQPSPAYRKWESGCKRAALYDRTAPPITWDVNCEALIYRESRIGDAVGYYQAIADCLQTLGVVDDDKRIVSWDGTRMLKDAENPRVEIVLTAVEGAQFDLLAAIPVEKKARARR